MLDSGRANRLSGNDGNNIILRAGPAAAASSSAGSGECTSTDGGANFKFFFPPSGCCFIPKDMPVPSWGDATDPFADDHEDAINAARKLARKLKQENKSPLDADKTAAICLYTLEYNGIYSSLNKALREAADDIPAAATILQPWTKYIRLLTEALNALPNYSEHDDDHVTLYRGVKQDLEASFKSVVGKVICWAAFTSCTTSMETLSNPMFVGTQGKRTIFVIKAFRGKDIKSFSAFGEGEAEVLLMATTNFKVTKVDSMGPVGGGDLTMVHLEEVDTTEGYPLLSISCDPAVIPMPPSSSLCGKHNEKIKFLCHDCGDQLVCNDCVMTMPCSEHKRRILLDGAIIKYQNEAQSNMANIDTNLQHDLDKMKLRLDRAAIDKQSCLDETKAIFEKYIDMLMEMKQSHLQFIEQAADARSTLLDSRCKQIGNMIAKWDEFAKEVNGLIAQSNNASLDNVNKFKAAEEAKNKSNLMKIEAADSVKILGEWNQDEVDDKLQLRHNYESVGKELESTIEKLKLVINPHLLHRIWWQSATTDSSDIPYKPPRANNSALVEKIWDERSFEEFMSQQLLDHLPVYNKLRDVIAPNYPGRQGFMLLSDYARLALLSVYGGYYADFDAEITNDPTQHFDVFDLVVARQMDGRINNAFIVASKGSQGIKDLFRALEDRIQAWKTTSSTETQNLPEVHDFSGPGLFSEVLVGHYTNEPETLIVDDNQIINYSIGTYEPSAYVNHAYDSLGAGANGYYGYYYSYYYSSYSRLR